MKAIHVINGNNKNELSRTVKISEGLVTPLDGICRLYTLPIEVVRRFLIYCERYSYLSLRNETRNQLSVFWLNAGPTEANVIGN